MQHSVRAGVRRWTGAVALVTALSIVFVWNGRASASEERSDILAEASDEEIFTGIVVGSGPVAEALPERTAARAAGSSIADSDVDAFVAAYDERFPGAIGELADAARSGQLAATRAEIAETHENLVVLGDETRASLANPSIGTATIVFVVLVVLAVAINYVDVEHRVTRPKPVDYQMAGVDPNASDLRVDRLSLAVAELGGR